jgi:hypothetical protein
LYNRSGFGEAEAQMGGLTDMAADIRNAETSITGNEDLMGRTYFDQFKSLAGWQFLPYTLFGLQYAAWDNINEDPTTFVKMVLDATADVDGKISTEYRNVGASGVKTNK